MPAVDWKYIVNQFDNSTKENFKRMDSLANDHDSKLEAAQVTDPAVAALYKRFHPRLSVWNATMNLWKNAQAGATTATFAFQNKLALLTEMRPETGSPLSNWDNQLAVAFPRTSTRYKTLFPRKHDPFHDGNSEERVKAIEQLAIRAKDAGAPAPLVKEIRDFGVELRALLKAQSVAEHDGDTARLALEPLRLELAILMYGALGILMDLHRDNPSQISKFWDLRLIRESSGAPPTLPPDPQV
ncbi:MAG: hypothetical protein JWL90_3834 [Chthoniobacteraceae bacterium]|nr:hypothetical protein [Chthoniobacteraceae bacterium]